MIQGKFLLKTNKKYFAISGVKWFLTALFHKFPTFSPYFGRKKLYGSGDVTRFGCNRLPCYANRGSPVFHRNPPLGTELKYLLKTRGFPHSPQVYPQEFSTTMLWLWNRLQIDIKRSDNLRQNFHFFAGGGFHNSRIFVQKFPP